MQKWRVLRSRHVIQDRWISIRADDCETADGVAIAPFYVVEYRDFVHVLAINESNLVVLVRQYRHGLNDFSLELPGGVMDPQDRDPVDAAMRELREETGYTGGERRLIASLSMDPSRYNNRLHLVSAIGVRKGTADPDASEEIEVELFTKEEAIAAALSGRMLNAAHVGLLLTGLLRETQRP